MSNLDDINTYIDQNTSVYLKRLVEYLSHPSISAQNNGVRKVANLLVSHLEALGFESDLIETDGYPFVLGRKHVSSEKPTVLLYGHYDVQPTDPDGEWHSPPFKPRIEHGRIWARGAGDNKGQHFAQLLALEAHLAVTGTLPCNVKFCLEGEEEVGSPNIAEFVEQNRSRLDADLVVTSDGSLHESGQPIMVFGVRGIASFELVAKGASRDVHSGNFGGVVPNPIWSLVHLLASMKDPSGRITVDGIAEQIRTPSDSDLRAVAKLPFDFAEVCASLGIEKLDVPSDRPYWHRLMFHPTLTVNGIFGGYQGPGSKSVLPNKAVAKCDIRLVPPLTPVDVFEAVEAHVRKHAPDVLVVRQDGMYPSKTPMGAPYSEAISEAIQSVHGIEPLKYPCVGGSLPEYVWTQGLKVPAFVVPYANADQANHAPNENLTVDCFMNGVRTGAAILHYVGEHCAPESSNANQEGV